MTAIGKDPKAQLAVRCDLGALKEDLHTRRDLGDFFDKPHDKGGLDVSRPLASAVLAAAMVLHMADLSAMAVRGSVRERPNYDPKIAMEIPRWLTAA